MIRKNPDSDFYQTLSSSFIKGRLDRKKSKTHNHPPPPPPFFYPLSLIHPLAKTFQAATLSVSVTLPLLHLGAKKKTPTITANSHILGGASTHVRTHVHTPTYTHAKSGKAAIKPTQAFLLWILIHFSTQLASIFLPYFPPHHSPCSLSLYISIPLTRLQKTIDGWLICVNADAGGNLAVWRLTASRF